MFISPLPLSNGDFSHFYTIYFLNSPLPSSSFYQILKTLDMETNTFSHPKQHLLYLKNIHQICPKWT